jgi:ADP-ribosylglycohydrolase
MKTLKQNLINAIYGQCVADAVGNKFEFDQDINPKDVVDYDI